MLPSWTTQRNNNQSNSTSDTLQQGWRRNFPEHTSSVFHAPKDSISYKDNPSLRWGQVGHMLHTLPPRVQIQSPPCPKGQGQELSPRRLAAAARAKPAGPGQARPSPTKRQISVPKMRQGTRTRETQFFYIFFTYFLPIFYLFFTYFFTFSTHFQITFSAANMMPKNAWKKRGRLK